MKNHFIIVLVLGGFFLMTACQEKKESEKETEETAEIKTERETNKVDHSKNEFGFDGNDYKFVHDTVQSGDSFGYIMNESGVSSAQVFKISTQVKDSFDTRRIAVGKPYTLVKSKDHAGDLVAFVYENDKINYTVLDLSDSVMSVHREKRPVSIKQRTISGAIKSSFSRAMHEAGARQALIHELVGVYQWKIDFFRIKKNDNFQVIFTEKYINDSVYAGIDNIVAAKFTSHGDPYYAFHFGEDTKEGFTKYYDEDAKSLQNFFLKAPVDYTRISSRYTKRRYHPVQKRWKAHLGTDYAAPTGTPIKSTADGVVIASRYTKFNGNYVKVRHNSKYTTQYLHMSKRKARKGEHVKQGEVIGYVGQTGLATGPHVCYRFWVNGTQKDPYKQQMPNSEPLADSLKTEYLETIEPLKKELDSLDPKNAFTQSNLANSSSH